MSRIVGERVIVIGGGLAGVTTLYELAADGIPAVLLEARAELAGGASHANGGALTPGLADPWNSPGVHKHIFASLFDPTSAMKLRLRAIPDLALWGLKFLRNSTPERHAHAMIAGYKLSAYSLQRTHQLRMVLDLDYDARSAGFLKVFPNEADMSESLDFCRILEPHGLRWEALDTDGVLAVEPSLKNAVDKIVCGIYYPDEASGDARAFTLELAGRATAMGAEVRTSARVEHIHLNNGRVTGVVVDGKSIDGDVVLAAGIDSPLLSRRVGLSLPIKPAKGYSLTVDASGLMDAVPKVPTVDQHMHAIVSPLGKHLRVAGTAEFAGRDERIRQARIDNLFSLFERLFPHLVDRIDRSTAVPWAGFRPMSADGIPFIGAAPTGGLWVNSGHGHMGWSMAAGSARVLCDLMQGRQPEIDTSPFRLTR